MFGRNFIFFLPATAAEALANVAGALTAFAGALTAFAGALTAFARALTAFAGALTAFAGALTAVAGALTNAARGWIIAARGWIIAVRGWNVCPKLCQAEDTCPKTIKEFRMRENSLQQTSTLLNAAKRLYLSDDQKIHSGLCPPEAQPQKMG